MPEKTFLLGVGCQKGGTTWLHQYLDTHPQCELGFQKEYHVFDALYLDNCRGIYGNRVESLADLLQKKKGSAESGPVESEKLDGKILRKMKLVSFYLDPRCYADYFDQLAAQGSQTRLVGDITPAYCALQDRHYTKIRALLESRGFTVKVIFLMRDPVERIYSAVYMDMARKKRRGKSVGSSPEQMFLNAFDNEKVEMRTRYEKTVTHLERSFDSADIFLGFYETLFNDEGVRKVTDFLGVEFVRPDTRKKIHAASRKKKLSAASANKVREYYDETYRFCIDRFGERFISSIWKHAVPQQPESGLIDKLRNLSRAKSPG